MIPMTFKILGPEEAKKRAKANVAEWMRQKEIEEKKAKTEKQRSLNDALLWTIDGYNGYAEKKMAEYRADNPNWHKDDNFRMDDIMGLIHGPMIKKVEKLLTDGADPNARNKQGFTSVMEAAENGDPELIRILAKSKADVTAQGKNGETALMRASFYANDKAVRALIDNGADLEARDKNGQTALMHASIQTYPTCCNSWHSFLGSNRIQTISNLLEAGANPNARDNDGKTALTLAKETHENPEIMAELEKHGATE